MGTGHATLHKILDLILTIVPNICKDWMDCPWIGLILTLSAFTCNNGNVLMRSWKRQTRPRPEKCFDFGTKTVFLQGDEETGDYPGEMVLGYGSYCHKYNNPQISAKLEGGARVGVGVVECCIFIRNTFPVSAIGSVIGRAEFHNFVFHRRLICTADAQKQLRPVAGGAGLVYKYKYKVVEYIRSLF